MENKHKVVISELLPFTVSLVQDAQALRAAVQIRQSAYARHLPDVAKSMDEAEDWDFGEGTVVLVARSKADGSPVGTMRLHTNEFAPLPLEQSFKLPDEFGGNRMVEATRFAVTAERTSQLVKTALFKACYLHSKAIGADRIVLTARSPLDRMYTRLLFTDVDESAGFVPMAHVAGIPHRVMHQYVPEIEATWKAARHPLIRFIMETEHPDILLPHLSAPQQTAPIEALSMAQA